MISLWCKSYYINISIGKLESRLIRTKSYNIIKLANINLDHDKILKKDVYEQYNI